MDALGLLTWIGIALCVAQSGTFSGLNLALFGVSALRLEVLSASGNADAARLLELRRDSNFLLATILWGNVGTNVLLALLADSVLAGAVGFVFSTFVITLGGEILPQAYFSRNALRMATRMRPVLRFWQLALYPLAKPTGLMLDAWLGPESIEFLDESQLRQSLRHYVAAPETDISRVEGIGAVNFLALDDLTVHEVGETLDPVSVIALPEAGGQPVFPGFRPDAEDPFLQQVAASGRKWVVITSPDDEPLFVLDADAFLRDALLKRPARPGAYGHRPIVARAAATSLGELIPLLGSERREIGDDVIEDDVILVWTDERRIITGGDLLGRLLRGIAGPG